MSSGWFPNPRRHWIDLIIAIIVMWLLIMVAVHELEVPSAAEPWRLNLASTEIFGVRLFRSLLPGPPE